MTMDEKLAELIRIYDQIEADLFAAFLENGNLEFQMRRSARSMAPALPSAGTPTVFMVYEADHERAKELLEEYKRVQAASVPPDKPDNGENRND